MYNLYMYFLVREGQEGSVAAKPATHSFCEIQENCNYCQVAGAFFLAGVKDFYLIADDCSQKTFFKRIGKLFKIFKHNSCGKKLLYIFFCNLRFFCFFVCLQKMNHLSCYSVICAATANWRLTTYTCDCSVGWSDKAIFCEFRKRAHCCRSGIFL